jgi:hypothetical protein
MTAIVPQIKWDETGTRTYETGIDHAVLYPQDTNGTYPKGYAWNGLTGVTESPSGAEANPQYADNIKYLNLLSAEDFGCTIEAYTYPDEFAVCDGGAEGADGLMLGQQPRKSFGLCYRTIIGNDVDGNAKGYKLHLIYGCLASPSEKAYASVNDSPEAIAFSWEVTTTPVTVTDFHPTSYLVISSLTADPTGLADLEEVLFGKAATTDPVVAAVDATLPLPDAVIALLEGGS